jgi:hypothetical protein
VGTCAVDFVGRFASGLIAKAGKVGRMSCVVSLLVTLEFACPELTVLTPVKGLDLTGLGISPGSVG